LVCFVVRISKISVKSGQFLLDYSNFNQSINHCVYFRLKTHKNRDDQRQTDNHKKHTTQKWDKNTHKTRQSQTRKVVDFDWFLSRHSVELAAGIGWTDRWT